MKKNEVLEQSFEFALEVIEYSESLEAKRKYVIARQILKSGTSVGANVREAQQAESRRDFVHKLKIASIEAEETEYWLLLCKYSKNYPNADLLLEMINSINKLLTKIISSARLNG
jgi:four helix bundle protein